MTQKQLSESTGIPRSSIGEMENGAMIPKERHLIKIAEVLGVNIDDLRE